MAEFFDQAHPEQSEDKLVSCGQLVVAMLLNGPDFVGRAFIKILEITMMRSVETNNYCHALCGTHSSLTISFI